MQLATRQRTNPPPVPPRPSRHVVAEALKRTPRPAPPPCPTRQAPPPPNTRPWRSEDHDETAAGRTVVYESGWEQRQTTDSEQVRSTSEPRSFNELQRSLASSRYCNDVEEIGSGNNIAGNTAPPHPLLLEKTEKRDGPTNRATSERSFLQQPPPPPPPTQPPLINDRRSISDDNILAHNRTDNFVRKHLTERKYNPNETREERKKRVFDKFMLGIGDEYSEIFEREIKASQLKGCGNEDIAKWEKIGKRGNRSEDDVRLGKSFSALVDETIRSHGEVKPETITAITPGKFEKTPNDDDDDDENKVDDTSGAAKVVPVFNANEEAISREATVEGVSAADPSGTETLISSDDRATVVVIEEAERKIAFNDDNDNIYHQDWLEAGIRYSSTKITLPGDDLFDRADEFNSIHENRHNNDDDERRTYTKLDRSRIRIERMSMSSLQGLPPLPRSLSGFNLSEGRRESAEPPPPPPTRSSSKAQKNFKSTQPSSSRPSPPGRQLTTLDTQLAVLRKEMFGLRQLDLSLLSQLWSLNESIQEFRQLLQEQEDRAPSPSPSSEEGDDNSYASHPPPPPRRPAPLLHHHRPPRPPRPLRPPASDESPSSEEYGAV